MAYTPHTTVKPEKIAATAVGLIYEDLLLPNLFQATSFDEYKGTKDETVNIKVPGLLPARSYAFRNDRSEPIEFDQYTETTVPIQFTAGRLYSAVELTDEQNDFDQITVNTLMPVQAQAVARGMEADAAHTMASGRYEAVVSNAEADLYRSLVEARALLRKFRVQGTRNLVVGTDFEAALLLDKRFTAAASSGNEAGAVMRSGNIGNWLGFNIFVSDLIEPDEAIAFTDSSFASATAAPYIPNSVPFGATASANGYGLRWIRDYDARYLVDRSVVDAYFGTKQILDRGFVVPALNDIKDAKTTSKKVFEEKVLDGEWNVRSLKMKLGAATNADYAQDNNEFLKALKIDSGNIDIAAKSKGAEAGVEGP